MAVNGRLLLERRKQNENACRSLEIKIAEDKRALQAAKFESLSSLKINTKVAKERTRELRDEIMQDLDRRRHRLADLYNDEMDGWRSEVMSNVETQEDRKARIIERAYALRDAREEQRRKIVEEKYNQQWRDACDDVRAMDSKALALHMSQERVQQVQDKIARKQRINSEEAAIVAEWNEQQDRAKELDIEKKAQAYQREVDSRSQLQDQILDNLSRKDKEYQRLEMEADEELHNIRESIKAEAEKVKKRQIESRNRGKEIYEFNQYLKSLEAEEERLHRHHDKILLDYALMRERENEIDGSAKKQLLRQQAIVYAEHLKEQACRDAEENAYMDDVHRKEEEKVWDARDHELKQRQEAKDYLYRMVDDGRREQIRSRQNEVVREREENEIESRKFLSLARQGVDREREEAIRRRNIRLENNDQLQDQIAYRRLKEEKEKQDVYLEEKRMKYVEREHKQKLAQQGGALRTNFPLKSGQWYS